MDRIIQDMLRERLYGYMRTELSVSHAGSALVHGVGSCLAIFCKKKMKLLCLWRKIDLTGSITNAVTDTKSMALSHSAWHKKLGKCCVCQFIFFSQSGPLAIPLNPSTA